MENKYKTLELSTQILIEECLTRGIKVEVLDYHSNTLRLSKGTKIEYVKQATKTSLDNYVSVLLAENKHITKTLLLENNINSPLGICIDNKYDINTIYNEFKGKKIIVKPLSTNFGIAINTLEKEFVIQELENAIVSCLKEDTHVLIENFIEGKEYRFLVINGKTIAVLHREGANITGDGKSSVRELVEKKNDSPLRGENYNLPLQKIKLESIELATLLKQGYNFDSIIPKDKKVYLRENSNISNGGDSIDFTCDIHPKYKEIAERAAKTLDLKITGIDIMLTDIYNYNDDYSIIELNFNPAIHIHKYPYIGNSINAAPIILDMLFGDPID